MDKDFMAEGQKSQFKKDEQEAFIEQQQELGFQENLDLPEDPMDTIADELNKTKDQLMRVTADFNNFKKRTEKERGEWHSAAQISVIKPFLTVLDDLDRALSFQADDENANTKTWLEGIIMIHKNLTKRLEDLGVKQIATDIPFNPVYHEALLLVEAEGREEGSIVEVMRKGYTYHDVVIRCAQVSVAK
jgi:molecular chaperone GrpE